MKHGGATFCRVRASGPLRESLRVSQHFLHLLPRNAWEPCEKIVNGRPGLQILEQGFHGDARAFEQPASAHLGRDALYFGTVIPVVHDASIAAMAFYLTGDPDSASRDAGVPHSGQRSGEARRS